MPKQLQSFASPAAMIGGLLWIAYAIFLLLAPWGEYVTRPMWPEPPALLNPGVFALTVGAGAAALAVLALAAAATGRLAQLPAAAPGRFGMAMVWMTIPAAVAAAVSGLAGWPVAASGALTAGEVLLAFGVLLLANDAAGNSATSAYGSALFVVGVVGMLGLMAQALVALVTWMLPVYGALVMAVYGLAWVRLGNWLNR